MNKIWVGIVTGLLLPAVFVLIYAFRVNFFTLWSVELYDILKPLIGQMLMIGAFADAALLFILYQFDQYEWAKGTMLGLLPYLLCSVYFMAL